MLTNSEYSNLMDVRTRSLFFPHDANMVGEGSCIRHVGCHCNRILLGADNVGSGEFEVLSML